MDKPKTTPKDFFLWAGAMVALYVSVFSFIALLFNYISYAYPDVLSYVSDPYSTSIRFEIASLIVLFPLGVFLMQLIRRDIIREPQKKEVWIRRWALMLTIFVAGATVAIDLIVLINNFLGGDLTWPFILKILVVFLVVGGCFLHFLAEMWGHWDANPQKSNLVAAGASAAVLCTIVAGFIIMGAPWNIRLYRLDDQKISDLQNIQSQIVSYWQTKRALPTSLTQLNDSISGYSTPVDSQTNQPYVYSVVGTYSFKLCAHFNAATQWNSPTLGPNYYSMSMEPVVAGGSMNIPTSDSWYHDQGNYCFYRGIDPTRYPPITQKAK